MDIQIIIVAIPAILLSLAVHEYAHAVVALWCGDTTAKDQGRVTLNPISHLDPIGTIMMIGTIVTHIVPFGWAKPVPINPLRFRHLNRDLVFVSFAGPLSNIIFANICGILILSLKHIPAFPFAFESYLFLSMLFMVNLSLSLFNLIPLPPLDGSKIVLGMLPGRMKPSYLHHSHYIAIVFIVLLIAESVLNIKSISYILNPIFNTYFMFWGQLYGIRGF